MLRRAWRRLVGEWKTLIERPVSGDEMSEAMQQASLPHFGFYLMLGLAAVIATFGLLSDSAPAIIGAMIIAPLMAPIISLSYGVAATNRKLAGRSLVTTVTGTVLVIGLAWLGTQGLGLRIAGSEILNRTTPTLLDLGIAMASGAAAAFAYSRRSIMSSIAGVAIAVALVPPLAVTGIGLAQVQAVGADIGRPLALFGLEQGGREIAAGAFLLFLTNLSGIVVVAGLVFLIQNYGDRLKGGLALIFVAAISLGLLKPLGVSLDRIYVRSQVLSVFARLGQEGQELFTPSAKLFGISVDFRGEVVHVSVTATAARDRVTMIQDRMNLFREKLKQSLKRPVEVDARVVLVDVFQYRSVEEKSGNSE